MRLFKLLTVSLPVISLVLYSGASQAFTFDFGDNHPPTWVETYGQPAPRYYYHPQINSFDRSRMIDHRQNRMQRRATTMNQLSDLLSGRYGFDREKAIKLARRIEQTAGYALARNFHPGSQPALAAVRVPSQQRYPRPSWILSDEALLMALRTSLLFTYLF